MSENAVLQKLVDQLSGLSFENMQQEIQLDAARALSAAVDAYLNAPTDRKAKEWGRFMQELATANRRFKEAAR